MDISEEFRSELKQILTSNVSKKSKTMSKKKNKKVSWVSKEEDEAPKMVYKGTPFHKKNLTLKKSPNVSTTLTFEDSSDEEQKSPKKHFRSTPFPKKSTNSFQLSNVSTTLSFETDSEENSDDQEINKSFETQAVVEPPKKRVKLNPKVNSNIWIEENISSPMNRTESSESEEVTGLCRMPFDPKGDLAKIILAKIRNKSFDSDSDVEDIETTFPEAEQIELLHDSGGSVSRYTFESSSESSSEDEIIIPNVVKNPKKFLAQCEISEPNWCIKLPNIGTKSPKKGGNSKKNVEKKNLDKKISLKNQITPKGKVESDSVPSLDSSANKKGVEKKLPEKMPPKTQNAPNEIVSEPINLDNTLNNPETEQNESSDSEFLFNNNDDEIDEPEFFNISTTPDKNIKDSVLFHLTPNVCILFLKHPSKLYFCGKLTIDVISGGLNILGKNFYEDSSNIHTYSSKGSSYLYLETIAREKKENLSAILKEFHFDESLLGPLGSEFSVISLRNVEDSMLRCLDNYIPQKLFPRINRTYEERYLTLVEMRLQCYFETKPSDWSVFKVSDEWESVIDRLEKNSEKLLVCGGKGVGKSTFVKYALNRLLNSKNKVVYIDLDPGQPEFTIPGCVSVSIVEEPLLGPNYTHLRKPLRCHFIGEVNITYCFNHYLDAVQDILAYCNSNVDKSIPWIINYMGFSKSLGSDLAISVIQIANPTLLVQIQSTQTKLNFGNVLSKEFVSKHISYAPIEVRNASLSYETKCVKSMNTNRSVLEARTLRDVSVIAYFSKMLNIGVEEFSSVAPYYVNLSSVKLSHINEANENIQAILNGSLVALCDKSISNCLGFGIVRGIDTSSHKLYLISPIEKDVIQNVDNIVMGVITLPASFYTTAGKYKGTVPYVCMTVKQATTDIPKRSYRACQYLLNKN